MVSNHKQLREENRFRILRLLHKNLDVSTHEIADALGISNSGAFYGINALVEKDWSNSEISTPSTRKTVTPIF